MFQTYNKETASATDRAAWALCQIIDDDAPLRWAMYRGIAECIDHNKSLMSDIESLSVNNPTP